MIDNSAKDPRKHHSDYIMQRRLAKSSDVKHILGHLLGTHNLRKDNDSCEKEYTDQHKERSMVREEQVIKKICVMGICS